MNNGRDYEEVALMILGERREYFGLERVEGKQVVPAVNGTTYEIDVIGYRKGNGRLVIFECRDYAKKLNQEAVRGFAYRIQVTGAESGYSATPVGLQSGAKLVADYERVNVIRIPRGASPDNYVIQFMHDFLAKVTEKMPFQDEIKVEVVRAADRASGPDRQ